jgi:pentose-5-phosphate-3-epimerase
MRIFAFDTISHYLDDYATSLAYCICLVGEATIAYDAVLSAIRERTINPNVVVIPSHHFATEML